MISEQQFQESLIAWASRLTADQKRVVRESLDAWARRVDASVSGASRAYADRVGRQLRERGYFRPN